MIYGYGGNDTLNGNSGTDRAGYTGNLGDYKIIKTLFRSFINQFLCLHLHRFSINVKIQSS